MRRRILVLASAAFVVAFAGCKHKCWKRDDCCGSGPLPPGSRPPTMIPPAGVPTTPGPFPPPAGASPVPSVQPPSGYTPAPKTGPDVLFPDPWPGSSSSRPTPQQGKTSFLGAPVKPQTTEPPKASAAPAGLPGYAKVKDGLYAGGKPTLDGFEALKNARFRTVIYLHAPGGDVAAIRDMASTRDLNFIDIETTPEKLADASKEFNRVTADKLNQPAYVFADDNTRAGALWYLHFRFVDSLDNDVARLRAKPLGLNEQGNEGEAFAIAIQKVLESR